MKQCAEGGTEGTEQQIHHRGTEGGEFETKRAELRCLTFPLRAVPDNRRGTAIFPFLQQLEIPLDARSCNDHVDGFVNGHALARRAR